MIDYRHPFVENTSYSSFVQLARYRAEEQNHKIAFTFLSHDHQQRHQLTYRRLDQKAKAIAAVLQDAGLTSERALLIYPPGLEFICAFYGCLYAGVIGVPTYPPINKQMVGLVERISRDVRPRAILTTGSIAAKLEKIRTIQSIGEKSLLKVIGKGLEKFFPLIGSLKREEISSFATDTINDDIAHRWRQPELNSDSLAFLQYTSGSTSQPRGVMVSHGNLLHNQKLIQQYFNHPMGIAVVSWLPQYHDMGLIGNIMQPLYLGGHCILFSPFEFIKRPLNWLRTISDYGAYTSGAPNFAYDMCVRKVTVDEMQELDLSSWRVAYSGAEPIRSSTLENFANTFSNCGFQKSAFLPCYGLAEATLIVTGGKQRRVPFFLACDKEMLKGNIIRNAESHHSGSTVLVGAGTAFNKQEVKIVDPRNRVELGENEIGEIWVAGPSVTAGYWNNPDATKECFHAKLNNGNLGSFLRTGDLGFLRDGELFVTGRLKDIIICYYKQRHK